MRSQLETELAHADILYPALVAEVKRQREEIARLRAALAGLFRECVMIHAHWGESSDAEAADKAIEAARAALGDR